MENKKYMLESANKDDIEFVYNSGKDVQRGCLGRLRGDFGGGGNEFWCTWEDETKELKADDFRDIFNDVINHFRFKSDTPLLKSRSDMRKICGSLNPFKLSNTFTDTYVFKVVTDDYTYFLRCCSEVGDYNFYIFAYNNEKLRKYKDIQLAEKHSDMRGKDKFFRNDSGFMHAYYNPDADAGGQLVYNEITHELIWDALADDISSDGFFEYIQSHCKQYLVDVGDLDFHDSFMSFVDDIAEFEGCTEDTMRLLQDAAQKDLYSYSVDDNDVMTVWEGSSILCTIQNVSKEKAEDLFCETVFEMRGISLDG